jgi:WD40 repeat protein
MDLERELKSMLTDRSHRPDVPPSMSPEYRKQVRRRQVLQLALPLVAVSALVASLMYVLPIAVNHPNHSPARGNEVPSAPSESSVYVFDGQGEDGKSNIYVFNTSSDSKSLVREFSVFGAVAMKPSPNGDRLYVASSSDSAGQEGAVYVFDTLGDKLEEVVPSPAPEGAVRPSFPLMSMSADGAWLYLLTADPLTGETTLSTMDTRANVVLSKSINLQACVPIGVLPSDKADRSVYVLCERTTEILFVQIGDDGSAANTEVIPLPIHQDAQSDEFGNERELGLLSYGALSPTGLLYVVTLSGRVYVVDTSSKEVIDQAKVDVPAGMLVALGQVKLSNDGAALIMGLSGLNSDDVSLTGRLLVVRTSDWGVSRAIDLTVPVKSFALGPGSEVTAVSPDDEALLVLDNVSDARESTFTGIGNSPEFVEVPLLGGG